MFDYTMVDHNGRSVTLRGIAKMYRYVTESERVKNGDEGRNKSLPISSTVTRFHRGVE